MQISGEVALPQIHERKGLSDIVRSALGCLSVNRMSIIENLDLRAVTLVRNGDPHNLARLNPPQEPGDRQRAITNRLIRINSDAGAF